MASAPLRGHGSSAALVSGALRLKLAEILEAALTLARHLDGSPLNRRDVLGILKASFTRMAGTTHQLVHAECPIVQPKVVTTKNRKLGIEYHWSMNNLPDHPLVDDVLEILPKIAGKSWHFEGITRDSGPDTSPESVWRLLARYAELASLAHEWGWAEEPRIHRSRRGESMYDIDSVRVGVLTVLGEKIVYSRQSNPPTTRLRLYRTLREIAETVGRSDGTIRTAIQKAGLPQSEHGKHRSYDGTQVGQIAHMRGEHADDKEKIAWNRLLIELRQPPPYPDLPNN